MNSHAIPALLHHYRGTARDLPWRGERDPYRILVSEVMLQQTRVETVIPYYERWTRRFPTARELAAADLDEVLKEWEGLGYYRRARNLHAAARAVVEAGTFPENAEALRALPGVGEYTAGAVASIAFGEAVPAVDGNVRRVLSRWYDEEAPTAGWLRRRGQELVAAAAAGAHPGEWNQALMELGATLCSPRSPECGACPVAEWCAARAAGTQVDRPAPVKKSKPREATILLSVIASEGEVLLTRRPDDGLLGGMWAFPEAELHDAPEDRGAVDDALERLAREVGVEPTGRPRAMTPVEHRFSHIHATYRPYVMSVRERPADWNTTERPVAWVAPEDTGELAIPVAQRKVMDGLVEEMQ